MSENHEGSKTTEPRKSDEPPEAPPESAEKEASAEGDKNELHEKEEAPSPDSPEEPVEGVEFADEQEAGEEQLENTEEQPLEPGAEAEADQEAGKSQVVQKEDKSKAVAEEKSADKKPVRRYNPHKKFFPIEQGPKAAKKKREAVMTPWVQRTMLYQVTFSVTAVFAGYTLLVIGQLLVSMYYFRIKLVLKADEVIEQQGVEALEHTSSNILTQIEQFQQIEEQLIERQSQFLLDILSDRHGVGIHPVDWESMPALSLNEIRKYPEPRPRVPVFHREIYQMHGRTLEHAKQLLSVY